MASLAIPTTYITNYNSSGLSAFTTVVTKLPSGHLAVLYSTTAFPINLSDTADISEYEIGPLGLIPKMGSKIIACEWPAGGSDIKASPMRRTLSLDVSVMVAGSVELILDSSKAKVLKMGDVLIHRGTMHWWRNTSDTETARMVIVVLPSETVTVGGRLLKASQLVRM